MWIPCQRLMPNQGGIQTLEPDNGELLGTVCRQKDRHYIYYFFKLIKKQNPTEK